MPPSPGFPSAPDTNDALKSPQSPSHHQRDKEPDEQALAARSTVDLRVATYNVRVDHHEDMETIHEWPMRRALVASTIRSLSADLIALQEPSPAQALDLEADLGPEWGVLVTPCDPDAWASAPGTGPAEGQARDGNGFVWRRSRLALLDSRTFWLAPDGAEEPWRGDEPAFGGSMFQRTCVIATFADKDTGQKIGALSTHFDHEGDDNLQTGGSWARRQSAAIVMGRANELLAARRVDAVIVCGCAARSKTPRLHGCPPRPRPA